MPRTIPYDKAPGDMQRAWDRLTKSNERLDKYLEDRVGDRDVIVDEQTAAVQNYRRIARAHGYIGSNGRTKCPHLST